jgi:hypothetical protein
LESLPTTNNNQSSSSLSTTPIVLLLLPLCGVVISSPKLPRVAQPRNGPQAHTTRNRRCVTDFNQPVNVNHSPPRAQRKEISSHHLETSS